MADNIVTNSGSGGATIATDECSIGGNTVHVPRNKIGYGADSAYTEVSATDGLPVQMASGAALTPHKLISAASTNATSVKASAGQIHGLFAANIGASDCWLKLYDKASAPTVGTDTPVATLLIPANSSGFNIQQALGIAFSSGIAFAITSGIADSDTGAVEADEVAVNIFYR